MIITKGTEIVQGTALKLKEVMPGVSKQELWGDPDGEHGAMTRFTAGFVTPMHTHAYDVRLVVVSGTLIHGDAGGVKTRLGPGSYCYIPAGQKHTAECEKNSDCLFYEEQPGKFDLTPVK